MATGEWLADRFEEHRAHLRTVAYRMLGAASEAEDAVPGTRTRVGPGGGEGGGRPGSGGGAGRERCERRRESPALADDRRCARVPRHAPGADVATRGPA